MKTILVVDDDENARIILERTLSKEGYATNSVSSGVEALQLIQDGARFDLIILDIKMFPLNGIQVLEELREKNIDIPVILYSDYPDFKNHFTTRLADEYLVKSGDLRELKEKVKVILTS